MRSLPSRFATHAASLRRGPTLANILGAAGVQLFLLATGTLLARLLGPEKRGYLAILLAIPSAVGQIGAVGMSLAATYFLSSRAVGGVELVRLLRRPAALQIAVLTLASAEIVLLYTFISRAPIVLAASIGFLIMPAALCLDYGLALLLGARRHRTASATRIITPALTAVGVVPLYLLHETSLAMVMVVVTATSAVSGAVALSLGIAASGTITTPTSIVAREGARTARGMILAFGRRGYLGYLSPVDSFKLDQLAVGFMLSPRALGIYVVGAAFTNAGRLVAVNLGMSATAEIAAHLDPRAQRTAVRRTLLLTGIILASLTAVLSVLVVFAIPIFFGASYRSSIPVAEILLVASLLLSLKRIAVDVMRGVGETRVGTRAEIVNLTLFLAAAPPLGLWLGASGVAMALVSAAAGGSVLLIRGVLRIGRADTG